MMVVKRLFSGSKFVVFYKPAYCLVLTMMRNIDSLKLAPVLKNRFF
jgi:hypothetical protein